MPDSSIIKLFGNDVDVTQWQDKHPGGKKLLKIFHNRDATQQFLAIHKGDQAHKMLKSLPQKPSSTLQNLSAAETEFQELVKKLEPELNKVNVPYEIGKVLYVVSFFFGGYGLCFIGYKYLGLMMMCLAMYQAGLVGHDYSHRSIFKSPVTNNLFSDGLGWIQGYSDIWWKSRHNTHHMVTNEIGNDPDVKTEPVLHFFDKEENEKTKNAHVPSQPMLFTAILPLLDVFWRYETVVVLMKNPQKHQQVAMRLVGHYILLLCLLIYTNVTVLDLVVMSLVRGFMTAMVVFSNHYPENRLSSTHSMGLLELTLHTSRNTTGLFVSSDGGLGRSLFNEATGFLSMQIEVLMSHLFVLI